MDYRPSDHIPTVSRILAAWAVCLGLAGIGVIGSAFRDHDEWAAFEQQARLEMQCPVPEHSATSCPDRVDAHAAAASRRDSIAGVTGPIGDKAADFAVLFYLLREIHG